jgi:Cu(I)/Ag(I) efflux system membrane fusion protein
MTFKKGNTMNIKNNAKWLPWLVLLVIAFIIGYMIRGGNDRTGEKVTEHVSTGSADSETTIWTCSMHPQIRMPKPGKCPICGMDLIPANRKEKTEETGPREIKLSEKARKLADIQTTIVKRKQVASEIRLFGKITYDETRLGYITARFPGRLDRLYVDYTGTFVETGQPMVDIYSPELLTAQQELFHSLQVLRDLRYSSVDIVKRSAAATVKAAREKLRLWGITPEQIKKLEKEEKPNDHITIYSPLGGVVIKKDALEGMYVKTGTRIYTIADLSSVWLQLDAYESDITWLHLGQKVSFTVEAYQGENFHGTITFIDPVVDEKTRTIKIRINVPNYNNKLKPDMFASAVVKAQMKGKGLRKVPLIIPDTAPLITGKRAIVYVESPDREGVYQGREIVLGPRLGNYYEVISGLSVGEKVVVKGNFKIDSAVQIMAKPSMMNPKGGGPMPGHGHGGSGTKHAPSASGSKIKHEGSQTKDEHRVSEPKMSREGSKNKHDH